MAEIYRFPDGKRIDSLEDEEALRKLKEKTYLPRSERLIRKFQEYINWLLHPIAINDRIPGEKHERKIFEKKNRERARLGRKVRAILYKKTKKTSDEKSDKENDRTSIRDKIEKLTG